MWDGGGGNCEGTMHIFAYKLLWLRAINEPKTRSATYMRGINYSVGQISAIRRFCARIVGAIFICKYDFHVIFMYTVDEGRFGGVHEEGFGG